MFNFDNIIMKITSAIYLLLIPVGIIMFGCKKKSSSLPVGVSAISLPVGMSAMLSLGGGPSNQWVAQGYTAGIDTSVTGAPVGIWLSGYDTLTPYPTNSFYFDVPSFKTGTFNLIDIGEYDYDPVSLYAVSGTITITQISAHNVQGTFNGIFTCSTTGVDYAQATNGEFNISY